MFDAASKAFFAGLAGSTTVKHLASRYGMRRPQSFARRFIAGETVAEAIEAARVLERAGLPVTLDLLGEGVESTDAATAATRAYGDVIQAVTAD
jgi:proline dehydrogenase